MSEDNDVIVYAVTFSNYDPPEVIAIYDNEEAASQHSEEHEAYTLTAWCVESEYRP